MSGIPPGSQIPTNFSQQQPVISQTPFKPLQTNTAIPIANQQQQQQQSQSTLSAASLYAQQAAVTPPFQPAQPTSYQQQNVNTVLNPLQPTQSTQQFTSQPVQPFAQGSYQTSTQPLQPFSGHQINYAAPANQTATNTAFPAFPTQQPSYPSATPYVAQPAATSLPAFSAPLPSLSAPLPTTTNTTAPVRSNISHPLEPTPTVAAAAGLASGLAARPPPLDAVTSPHQPQPIPTFSPTSKSPAIQQPVVRQPPPLNPQYENWKKNPTHRMKLQMTLQQSVQAFEAGQYAESYQLAESILIAYREEKVWPIVSKIAAMMKECAQKLGR